MAWKTPEERETQSEAYQKRAIENMAKIIGDLKRRIEEDKRANIANEFLKNHPKKG